MPSKHLYKHQEKFLLTKGQSNALLVWETGTGKTVAACEWIRRRRGPTLVICPKSIVGKWERDLKEWGVSAHVVSRDHFKKHQLFKQVLRRDRYVDTLPLYDNIVVDEAHDFASPLFTGGTSQRARVLYNFIKTAKPMVLLLTATPVRSTPWNIHTLACYLGWYLDVKRFRDEFFYLTDRYGRMHWEVKPGWQKRIRPYVERISDIVLMKDCVDVPPQTEEVIRIPWTKANESLLPTTYQNPSEEWFTRHRAEQGIDKFEKLDEILDGYRKAIVVCNYRDQIDDYVKRIGSGRQVFVLHGGVRDQDKVIQDAREADECVFIVQASMGSGFDASEFSIVIFASLSFKYVDFVQMKGRVKRINNLHANHFIHLIGGKCDQAVYDTIQRNRDFDVHDYLDKQPSRPSSNEEEAGGGHHPTGTPMVPSES